MASRTKKKEDEARRKQQQQNEISSNEVSSEPAYDSTEVNGKFKIMDEFTPELEDPASPKYQELSANIIRGIEELLEKDDEMKQQADYTVTILGFK